MELSTRNIERPVGGDEKVLELTLDAAKQISALLRQIRNIWNQDGAMRHQKWAEQVFRDGTVTHNLEMFHNRWDRVIIGWGKKPTGGAYEEVRTLLEEADLTKEELIEVKERVEEYFG